jgi:hypothetical protein
MNPEDNDQPTPAEDDVDMLFRLDADDLDEPDKNEGSAST